MPKLDRPLLDALGIPAAVIDRYAPHAEKKSKKKSGRFNLHGPIVDDKTAEIFGMESLYCPKDLRDFLAEHEGEDIEINVNSPGGSVWDAFSMRSELLRHEGKVTVVVSGACLSAATQFLAIPKSERMAMPGSEFMIHNAWTCVCGDHNDLIKEAASLEKTSNQIAKELAKAFGKEVAEVRSMMDAETWFDTEEALDAGMVDSVFGMDDDSEDEKKDEDTEPEPSISEARERGKARARYEYQRRQRRRQSDA